MLIVDSFQKIQKEPWQIAAARYCVNNAEKGFNKLGLVTYIKSQYAVNERHIEQFWDEEIFKPPGRNYSRSFIATTEGGLWIPPLSLVSTITDYDALQEARESSRKAMYIATGSLLVAIVVGMIQIWIALYHQ